MKIPRIMTRVTGLAAVALLVGCATSESDADRTTVEPGDRGEVVRDTVTPAQGVRDTMRPGMRDTMPPGARDTMGVAEEQGAMNEGTAWTGLLEANEGFEVTGEASARPGADGTRVSVEIRGAKAGAIHPWHIHEGTCGSGGSIVGQASAYSPLNAGQDGNAEATASIEVPLSGSGEYYVNIHKSPSESGTIAACGPLRSS